MNFAPCSLSLASPLGNYASTRTFSPVGASCGQAFEDCLSHHFGRLHLLGLLTWKGEGAHAGAGCAGIDDVDADPLREGGFVGISAEQRLQCCLGRSVRTPESPRLGANRRGECDYVGARGFLEEPVESRDQRLRSEQVEAQESRLFLRVDVLNRA